MCVDSGVQATAMYNESTCTHMLTHVLHAIKIIELNDVQYIRPLALWLTETVYTLLALLIKVHLVMIVIH